MTHDVRRLSVPAEAGGERLDRFLALQLPLLSRTRIQELIHQGRVQVNDQMAERPGFRLQGGEWLTVEVVERPPLDAVPESIPLDVLYEDDDLVAVNKPAGMVVHAGGGVRRGTLVNALLHRFGRLSRVGGPVRPGIVHRLDKGTSGVLLVAKSDEVHQKLAAQFSGRTVEKRYLALVHGEPPRKHDVIRLSIARDRVRRTRMTTRRRLGRPAETEYRVLRSRPGFAFLEVFLRTGRTHQVRVHLSALGHPVVGDTLYGAPRRLRWDNQSCVTLNRNFLHAERLRFHHPRTNLEMEISAPLPEELSGLLQRLVMEPS